MKRSQLPARNWVYGASAPRTHLQLINDAIWHKHRLYNKRVEIELARRAAVAELTRELSPELAALEAILNEKMEAARTLEDEITLRNREARRVTSTAAERGELAGLKKEVKTLSKRCSAERKRIYATTVFQERSAPLNAANKLRVKAATLEARAVLFWGVRWALENDVRHMHKGAPPGFHRWDGNGSVSMQIQRSRSGLGMGTGEVFEDWPTNFRILPPVDASPDPRPGPREAGEKRRTIALLRVGSDSRGRPIWAEIPFRMHRPLPAGCRIKSVHLDRFQVATHFRWQLRLVLSYPKTVFPAGVPANVSKLGVFPGFDKKARISVEAGWRPIRSNSSVASLRVACWSSTVPIDVDAVRKYANGADGISGLGIPPWTADDGLSGELFLPSDRVRGWFKCYALQQTRRKIFNIMHPQLMAWMHTAALPPWFVEATRTIAMWKSEEKLRSLVLAWRANRFNDDAHMFEQANAWFRQEKHLYDWERRQMAKQINWRDHIYRCFAASLRRSFGHASVEAIDWRKLAEKPACENRRPEDSELLIRVAKYRKAASVGRLVECIEEAMPTERHAPAYTTQRCHACKLIERFDKANEIVHVCSHCGAIWDQDVNAAIILKEIGLGNMPELPPDLHAAG